MFQKLELLIFNVPNPDKVKKLRFNSIFISIQLSEANGSLRVNHSSESVRFLGPKFWEIVPTDIKELDTLKDTIDKFTIALKKWKPVCCPYRLYKVYVQNIGYI